MGTYYTFAQIQQIWMRNGGAESAAAMAAAIALAESSGYDMAYNYNAGPPASVDYGLWQINSYYNGGSTADYNVDTCAKHAIRDSGNGSTWRPWCTAYSDGACGTRGGCYLCAGAPYQKYLGAGAVSGSTGGGGGHRTLSLGMSGDDVKQMQLFLWNLGYTGINTDGHFTENTKTHVEAFQRDNRLTVDGIVGPQTWGAMEAIAAGGNAPPQAGQTSAVGATSSGQGIEAPPLEVRYTYAPVPALGSTREITFAQPGLGSSRVSEVPHAANLKYVDTAATTGSGVTLNDLVSTTRAIEQLGT